MIDARTLEAEASVIGACLLESAAYWRVSDRLTADDFADARHAVLWRAIGEQLQAGNAADAVTLGDWLDSNGLAAKAGGVRYVLELANTTPSAAAADSYAGIVAERAALRRIVAAGHAIAIAGKRSDAVAAHVADEARRMLVDALPIDARAVVSAKSAVRESFDSLRQRYEADEGYSGLVTGIAVLDDATDGLQPERLYILAARPSMGKSLVAGYIAGTAGQAGKRCAIFSAEMAAREWADRWVSMVGKVSQSRIARPKLMEDGDWSRVTTAMAEIQQWPVMLDASPSHSVATITARAMQMHAAAPLELIVIDHLGLLDLPMRKGDTRANALGEATKAFKALSKRMKVPVLLLCQLNRDGDGHEPSLKDLRDSGRIEEDADGVFMLHRLGYYDPSRDQGYTKLIVAKLRAGKRDTLEIYCDLERMTVNACTHEQSAAAQPAPRPQRGFGRGEFRQKARGE